MLSLLFLLGSLTQKTWYVYQNQVYEFPIYRDMGKPNFSLNVVAAILKFKIAAHTKIPNALFTCRNGFLDP